MHYFFIYFYSVSYEQDMSLNTKEAVARTINEVNDDVSKDVRKSFSNRDGSFDSKYRQSLDEITEKSKDTNYYEAQKYIDKVKSKMILARFYDGISTAI